MSIVVAIWIVRFVGLYLTLGALFALAFVTRGVGRIDPAARNASLGFRVLLLPGSAALWPLLLKRWGLGAGAPPTERNAHRDRASERGRK